MVRRAFNSCGAAYWNDLLPKVSSLKSGTVSRPLSFDLSDTMRDTMRVDLLDNILKLIVHLTSCIMMN